MSGRLRRIAIDVTPLRVSRDFRLLWTGSLISALGSQFVRVGLYIQVYALTGSPAQVGLLGVSALAGNVAGTFIGGSFIDAHDRRGVLIWTQVGHVAVSGWLVAGAIGGHPPLLLLHVANLLTWGLGAIDGAFSAVVPVVPWSIARTYFIPPSVLYAFQGNIRRETRSTHSPPAHAGCHCPMRPHGLKRMSRNVQSAPRQWRKRGDSSRRRRGF